jgi:hypothetical protein
MKRVIAGGLVALALVAAVSAADIKVDLSKEAVGRAPALFTPMVGTWVIAQDGPDKVVMVDGRPWVASKDNPTKLLIESARKLYGTSNEELMDNAKQFAYYPVAILNGVKDFSNGAVSLSFKIMGGEADRTAGIVFNVKSNGDWLAIRYSHTDGDVALWEFHKGIRRRVAGGQRLTLDRGAWHELKMTVDGADFKTYVNGAVALEYTLGSEPRPGRNGAAPNEDLFPANNPVLRPPVSGQIGLWAKTDSTTYFKDYVVSPK